MKDAIRVVILGQTLMVICCAFYLIWWYRGFRPGVGLKRVSGINGVLLLITAIFGISGIAFSLQRIPEAVEARWDSMKIAVLGIVIYIVLLIITKYAFHRIVTSELILIVGWTTLELVILNRLYAAASLTEKGFIALCTVITAAFLISIVLYVAYYRMEEMMAFYAAMVPLVTEGLAMGAIIGTVLSETK